MQYKTNKGSSIQSFIRKSIDYIINPEKTINKDYGKESYNYLEINTTEYNFKNEKVCYVSSLNCSEDNPYEDMKFTKERFGKTDGILAFHGYQSFKENEVTPDVAHKIGIKFAEEMFGDYEVVVSTHQFSIHYLKLYFCLKLLIYLFLIAGIICDAISTETSSILIELVSSKIESSTLVSNNSCKSLKLLLYSFKLSIFKKFLFSSAKLEL